MLSRRLSGGVLCILCFSAGIVSADESEGGNTVTGRRPTTREDFAYWLRNAIVDHHFSFEETALALDASVEQVKDGALRYLAVDVPDSATEEQIREALLTASGYVEQQQGIAILPYPGGRHPRIGFLDGAIDPQRETKVSVFTPWQPEGEDRADYVVVDVPEAIWSNLGLTYLAHTHVPTIWTMQGIELDPLEWISSGRVLSIERTLPNGISFSSEVTSHEDHVSMQMTLTNGTDETLSDLRVQNCVMLKAAEGFNQQTNDNKHFRDHYVAVHDESGERWIITAWLPLHRAWANPPCPCLHSDPIFPDCAPDETQTIHGWLSFYEGTDIDAELDRIEMMKWWEDE
jgi:hypothetical protein